MTRFDESLTSHLTIGDYILLQTGATWTIKRSHGDGTANTVSASDEVEDHARNKILDLAAADRTTAWQLVGPDVFRQIQSYRP
jgi:hypothetical protein